MEWPTKDILISFKPLAFEMRMDLVLSSPKGIDILMMRQQGAQPRESIVPPKLLTVS